MKKLIFLFLILGCFSCCFAENKTGYCTGDNVNVRSGHGEKYQEFKKLYQLNKGDCVTIIDEDQGWYKISSDKSPSDAKSIEQWVLKKYISSQNVEDINDTSPPPQQKVQEVDDGVSFEAIRKASEDMTDLQFDEFAKGIQGKRIVWTGWVCDVSEGFFGGYDCSVDMDDPSVNFSVQDLTFSLSKSDALQLKKDQKIKFAGKLSRIQKLMGLMIEISEITGITVYQ